MSQFIQDFRTKNPQYDDMQDDQLVTALHGKYYSDIPLDQFSQKIGFQSEPLAIESNNIEPSVIDGFTGADKKIIPEQAGFIESKANEALDNKANFMQKVDELKSVNPDWTDSQIYEAIEQNKTPDDITFEQSQEPPSAWQQKESRKLDYINSSNVDVFTGADSKAPIEMSMGEMVSQKLSAIGEGLVRAGQNVVPQFKSQLGGLMQTQETPILTPTEFFANGQKGKTPGSPVPFEFKSYEDYANAYNDTISPTNWIGQKGKELRAQAKGEMKASTAERGSTEYYIEQGVSSILNMAPMLAMSVLGKRPDLGLGIMLAQVDGDAYGEGRDKGLSQSDAKAYAAFQSVAEVIPSALPLSRLLSGSGMVSSGLSEGAQELVTAALQAGIDKKYIDPNMTWGEAAERMKDAAIIGAGSGATLSLITKPFAPKEESYADDPLKALAVEMDQEAANNELKDFATKAFDKETANTILQDKQSIVEDDKSMNKDNVNIAEESKVSSVVPEQVKSDIKEQPIDNKQVLDSPAESVKFEYPQEEKPIKQQIKGKEVVEAPISEITVSEDVPQFKEGANAKGVVEPLGGKFERTGVAPVQIWVRENGRKEVISGRHRLDLADRSGEKTIPAQYHYESEGFGADQAAVLDAMLNIREGQGKVKDYVDFIKATKPRKAEANEQGILARQTGKRAFTIATEGSDALIAAHRNDQLTDEAATRIAESAPRSEKLQAVGIKAIQEGKAIAVAENMVKAVKYMANETQQESGDLFGFDDSAMVEAEDLAKAAVKKQSSIQKTLTAVKGAAKNPELAAKEGVDVKDPEAVKQRIKDLEAEKRDWNNWHTNPELTKELKAGETSVTNDLKPKVPEAAEKGKDSFTNFNGRNEEGQPAEQSFVRGEYVKAVKSDKDKTFFEGGEIEGISKTKKQVKVRGVWHDFGSVVKADKPAEAKPPTKKMTEVIDSVNKKAAKGITEEDKIPKDKPTYEKKPIEAYNFFRKSIADQTATVSEIEADAKSIVKNKDNIIAAMSERKFTKAMLQKITHSPRSDLSKPQMVKIAFENMLSSHVMGDATFTIFGGSESFQDQMISKIEKQTQADVDASYEKQREYRAEMIKRKEDFVKSLTDPKTLPELKEFIRVRGKSKLTADQLANYDELISDSLRPEDKPAVIQGESEAVTTERAKTTHTKTGADLFVVKMIGRVGKDKFRELSAKSKQLGGYYSSYSKGGAIPGFQFKTIEEADQFEQMLSGKDIAKSDFSEAKAEVKQAKNADKLLDMAEKMEAKATEEINRPRQANTSRRASMAAGATERAEKQLAIAKTVRNIAIKLQEGDLNHLGKISQVTQLEELISIQNRAIPSDLYEHGSFDGYSISRPLKEGVTVDDYIANVKYPLLEVNQSNMNRVSEKLAGKKGFARISKEILRLPTANRGEWKVLSKDNFSKLKEAEKKGFIDKFDIGGYAEDRFKTISRLERLGITQEEQLRAAIRELDSLRVAKRKADPIKQIERDLVGKKIDGFFPTPKTLVDQMIDYADIQEGHEVLEPSAGKGNIAEQIVISAPSAILDVVEYNSSLSSLLELKGYNVVGSDFLEYSGKKYDRIVMNPPFENHQDIDHVQHAFELLKPGGKLVAIMGAGVKNSRKKSVNFRAWLDDNGSYIEDLPEGSFKSSDRSTNVNTVMVTIDKSDSNTLNYKSQDEKTTPVPKEGDRVFNAPGHNFIGMFRSTGIPERREFVTIEGRRVKIPESPQRIEPIMSKLIKITGRRIYFGKIKGKSQEGFYRPAVGEIRTRRKNDVEVLAHEMAHYLDVYSNITLPNFQKLYKDPLYAAEVAALSYTNADREIEQIEGFAEFVRLWLTNANEAQARAPKFYEAFTNELARDRKLLNPMRDMQDLMHKFYFQGADKLGQALIGQNLSYKQRFNEWAYRRDSRIRQQGIDRFHAARKIEQELTRKVGTVQESAWKQLRIANGGAEGIADFILNYGTVKFNEQGDLKRSGKSLHEVMEPVKTITLKEEHKGQQKIDLLMRYFAGRRALELHGQGRENLIPKETAKVWARLGQDYPVFESIQKEYQQFNDRMMDFYEESGMVTKESRKTMQSMNKDYVPFNRIRDQLAGGKGGSGGFQRLKGGTANLNDILVNIQDGITANVRSALTNRAKQRLYQYISGHKDGAIFATKLATDSKPVKVYAEEMQSKIGKILQANGVEVEGDLDLISQELLTFWQHGVAPKVNESGNIVDSVIVDGKPRYYEVQDPLLQDMLISMNPESYSSFMNVMFGVKNFFTRSITLGIEFTGANLVRDTIGATFLSKNNFKPFISSFQGMYSFLAKDKYYQDFIRSGGGHSGRLEGSTRDSQARRRVKLDEFGVMTGPERLLSTIDHLASAFEYGTRIGEYRLSKKNMASDMDAGFDAREISTDFSVLGANRFVTGWIRTVPFLNAMIQSQDRVYREALVSKKYNGNPVGMAMKAFLGITIPTLILYLVNKDDDDYKEIPDYEKRTNWHIKIGDGQFVKIPRPYDVGFVYATMPELFAKYLEDDKGKEFSEGMIWTLTQMYGVDGVPAMMTGWWDLVRNKKWTGAPVVPQSLASVSAPEQYTSNTSETFVRLGEALGISPIKSEHMFKAYTGYLGGYLMAGTDHLLWDESKFGEKPDRKLSENVFLKRFLTPEVRPSTANMEKFFDLKEKSDRVVSTFKQSVDVRRKIKGQMGAGKFKGDRFFGLSSNEKEVLFALNDSMNKLIKIMYGKEGIKTAELKIKYDKKLSGKEKRDQMDKLWLSRNDAFEKYYQQANKALQKAKKEHKQEK